MQELNDRNTDSAPETRRKRTFKPEDYEPGVIKFIHRDGYAFVTRDNGEPDAFFHMEKVPPHIAEKLFEGCKVVDLGAGNGVLGLGALAMGAGRATLVEADQAACDVAKSNAEKCGRSGSGRAKKASRPSKPCLRALVSSSETSRPTCDRPTARMFAMDTAVE